VNVVAAGVHHRLFHAGDVNLGHCRGVGKTGVLAQRQRVHVGAHQHQRPFSITQHADNAGTANTRGNLDSGRTEFVGETGRG
jgi:hypothetical protein